MTGNETVETLVADIRERYQSLVNFGYTDFRSLTPSCDKLRVVLRGSGKGNLIEQVGRLERAINDFDAGAIALAIERIEIAQIVQGSDVAKRRQ